MNQLRRLGLCLTIAAILNSSQVCSLRISRFSYNLIAHNCMHKAFLKDVELKLHFQLKNHQ
ncbi:hypothetical protein T07_11000 [Trichinella nelsoni]|uniref:Uncharacterized protein n=1 Tax=Trichinella nelsoni TaxID=6336 RepID=A0A0V0SHK9_9BILA|nr:hypothetical protein T07_11000 [Trichinella nelsoni]